MKKKPARGQNYFRPGILLKLVILDKVSNYIYEYVILHDNRYTQCWIDIYFSFTGGKILQRMLTNRYLVTKHILNDILKKHFRWLHPCYWRNEASVLDTFQPSQGRFKIANFPEFDIVTVKQTALGAMRQLWRLSNFI